MSAYDVVVAGAGPAGSVAARQLALEGLSVLLVDRARFPRWKVCGGCLGPAAVRRLQRAGLSAVVDARGVPLSALRLFSGRRAARIPLRGNVALSRTLLDTFLLEEAERAGADVRESVRARIPHAERREPIVRGEGPKGGPEALDVELVEADVVTTVSAGVVLDATGLHGALTDRVAEPPVVEPGARVGLGAVFDGGAWDLPEGELHMVVGRSGYVGLVRTEDDSVIVAAAVDTDALTESGDAGTVAAILHSAGLASPRLEPVHGWRGTPRLTRRAALVAGHRLLRLGDAASYVEPFTGEGMAWAIGAALDVVPLARAGVGTWRPELAEEWVRRQAEQRRRRHRVCRWLARGLRRPALVRTAVGTLRSFPSLAAPLVRAAA